MSEGTQPGGPRYTRGDAAAAVRRGAPTYIDRLVPAVMRRLDDRKKRLPQDELEALAGPVPRSSFADAIRLPGLSLVAEVKRASPSRGPIRPDLDVAAIVRAYEAAGARAVSVLTEEDHFRGSLEDLRVAAANTGLPLLRKDFILDEYQVHEARAFGASAVLLIAALLSDDGLGRLAGLAFRLGLDVLIEVHEANEMARALGVEAAIIGVNNRDLHTFSVSLDTTARLANLVPPGRLLIGESGILDHADVAKLARFGVDGILVGESILRNKDVGWAIRGLLNPPVTVASRPVEYAHKKEAR